MSEKFRKYHDRMQLFMLLYVEGSSYIDSEDDKWNIYTVYGSPNDAYCVQTE